MFNIYRMLFLVLKKVEMVKFTPPQIPTTKTKFSSKKPLRSFPSHPSTVNMDHSVVNYHQSLAFDFPHLFCNDHCDRWIIPVDNPARCIKSECQKMKKEMQRTNVMWSILANTIQLDNTQTHVDMQANHQNEIEKCWKPQQVGIRLAIKIFILS